MSCNIVGLNRGEYTFDASAQTITFTGYTWYTIQQFKLIVNLTDNEVIYNPLDDTKGGTLAGNVLTLTFDTTTMEDTDELLINFVSIDRDKGNEKVEIGEGPNIDPSGRIKVSNPETLFDASNIEGLDNFNWEDIITGTATITKNVNNSEAILATVNSGDSIIRQQHGYNHYIPNKGMVSTMTFAIPTAVTNGIVRVGYHDADDGLYFEQDGLNGWYVVRRTSASGVSVIGDKIAQANWNMDKLDGSGGINNPSGKTLDKTKGQIAFISFKWLGFGPVLYGVEIDGIPIVVHKLDNSNVRNEVFMRTGSLPLRFEVIQNGASPITLSQFCSSVHAEGGYDRFGNVIAVDTEGNSKAIPAGQRQSVISIRMKEFIDAAIPNRRTATPISISLDTDQDALIEVVIQHITEGPPVFTGTPTWTDAGVNSGLEWTTGIDTITGGHKIASQNVRVSAQAGVQGLVNSVFSIPVSPINATRISRSYDVGESDLIHFMVTPQGNSQNVAAIVFKETY